MSPVGYHAIAYIVGYSAGFSYCLQAPTGAYRHPWLPKGSSGCRDEVGGELYLAKDLDAEIAKPVWSRDCFPTAVTAAAGPQG